jgi:hypothetical protein
MERCLLWESIEWLRRAVIARLQEREARGSPREDQLPGVRRPGAALA